jgi:hypothetical protein
MEFLEQIAGYIDKKRRNNQLSRPTAYQQIRCQREKYFAKFVEIGILKVEGKNKGRKYLINRK